MKQMRIDLKSKLGIAEELIVTRTPTHLRIDQVRESQLVGQMYIPGQKIPMVVAGLNQLVASLTQLTEHEKVPLV